MPYKNGKLGGWVSGFFGSGMINEIGFMPLLMTL